MPPDVESLVTALATLGLSGSTLAVAKSLSQPWCLRITEMLERAGTASLAPVQMKRLARAKAETLIIEARAKADADLVALEGQFRLEGRALEREIEVSKRQQANLDQISVNAARLIVEGVTGTGEQEPPVQPVEEDWSAAFFDYAKHISSEQMQELWARLLAGEIQAPGAFSLRTLSIVSQLRKAEADQFAQLAACVWTARTSPSPEMPIVFAGTEARKYLSRIDLGFDAISGLEELGLVKSERQYLEMEARQTFEGSFGPVRYQLTSKALSPKQLHKLEKRDFNTWPNSREAPYVLPIVTFTRAGKELLAICKSKPNQAYLRVMKRDFAANSMAVVAVESGNRRK